MAHEHSLCVSGNWAWVRLMYQPSAHAVMPHMLWGANKRKPAERLPTCMDPVQVRQISRIPNKHTSQGATPPKTSAHPILTMLSGSRKHPSNEGRRERASHPPSMRGNQESDGCVGQYSLPFRRTIPLASSELQHFWIDSMVASNALAAAATVAPQRASFPMHAQIHS